MSKKSDQHCQNNPDSKKPSQQPNPKQSKQVPPKTPDRKNAQYLNGQVFSHLSPFPIPPKFNMQFTAISHSYHSFSNDMKVIETPYNNQRPEGTHKNDMEDINEQLKAISNKIQWDRTPQKSQGVQSEYDQEDQEEAENSQIIEEEEQQNYQDCENYEEKVQENHSLSVEQNPEKQNLTNKNLQYIVQSQKPFQITSNKRIFLHKKQLQSSVPTPNNSLTSKKVYCNCKKTKCLKLYCDCFRINQTCEGCNCAGCHNSEEYEEERNHAILVLMDRNPDPFSQKIEADKHLKGCNCKKSFCQKKYCQCYQAGLKCGQNCKCDQCKNGGGLEKREKDRLEKQQILKLHEFVENNE